MGLQGRVPSRHPGGQGGFRGRNGADAEAERLCKMGRRWSSEEHREYFSGTKVASVMLLSWAGV